ncbi:MAG: OmpA family protein [Acidobacteriota bacterium]|nr:OmpA family protein [Acidobacteriota bacterium]
MQTQRASVVAAVLTLVIVGGCATRGSVATVAEHTREVERRVGQVERSLEETTVRVGHNAAHIQEVDQTAANAQGLASDALDASRTVGSRVGDATTRIDGLETAGRRLLFEVMLTEDHGQFGFGDAGLPEPVSVKLDALVKQLETLETSAHLEIEGHADATGPSPFNARLGLRRAESVRRYLYEQHGLPLHKISVISYGEDKPVAPNDTVEGRAMNRRVVVRVLG